MTVPVRYRRGRFFWIIIDDTFMSLKCKRVSGVPNSAPSSRIRGLLSPSTFDAFQYWCDVQLFIGVIFSFFNRHQ
jgi:hypothetical protein